MSEFVTIGSSNTIKGNKVAITIKISKEKGGEINFSKGKITISNLDKLISNNSSVYYKDNVSSSHELNYSSGNNYYFKSIVTSKNITNVELEITGQLNEDFDFTIPLKINFKENNVEQNIDFKVVKSEMPIQILKFVASSNIIQKSKNNLQLQFSVTGNPTDLTLLENGKELNTAIFKKLNFKENDKIYSIENLLKNKQPGNYEYTLQATKANQVVSKSETVLYVDESKITNRTQPTNCTIINFCAAQNGDYLFALTYNNKELQIHYTNQIDGDNWQEIQISDIEKIKPYINSPMVHLQSTQEKNDGKLGRILFIGGSRIENTSNTTENGNQVAIIELNESVTQISINEIQTWQPRWGHACVIFPKGQEQNTIWMLGGEDEYGNTTNEVWTSTNGIEWTKENNASWQHRTMHSACVSYQIEKNLKTKEAIYLGGGFKGIGNECISDVWKYSKSCNWEKITDNHSDIKAFGIGYGGIENTGDTGVYTIKSNNERIINKLIVDNQNKYILNEINTQKINMFNQGIINTAFFKECLWFMTINGLGSSGISYSDLFYRIPTLHQTTIDFYSNPKNK